ncbi:uncharacterized protein LOC120524208 [Polypterus senegalus]|uniref:uncharacterized protein LOC120524208 n=1 Tax=Polypterus senegalus TaxID=55291 RepID=UPI001963A51E|nr:uncharacterized protein LOC120524208 [Polypterus senegalus]
MLLFLYVTVIVWKTSHLKKETIQMEFGKNISLICSNHTWSELVFQKWSIWKLGIGKCDIEVLYNGTIKDNCTNNPVYVNSTNPHLSISNFESNYVGKYSCEYTFNGGTDKRDYYLWGVHYINHTFGENVSLTCFHQMASNDMVTKVITKLKYEECVYTVGKNQILNQTIKSTCEDRKDFVIDIKDGWLHLDIPGFQLKDVGNYTCETRYNEEIFKLCYVLSGYPAITTFLTADTLRYCVVPAAIVILILISLAAYRYADHLRRAKLSRSSQNC